jgi:hypothetical protein
VKIIKVILQQKREFLNKKDSFETKQKVRFPKNAIEVKCFGS